MGEGRICGKRREGIAGKRRGGEVRADEGMAGKSTKNAFIRPEEF